jgi:hypothetical protein
MPVHVCDNSKIWYYMAYTYYRTKVKHYCVMCPRRNFQKRLCGLNNEDIYQCGWVSSTRLMEKLEQKGGRTNLLSLFWTVAFIFSCPRALVFLILGPSNLQQNYVIQPQLTPVVILRTCIWTGTYTMVLWSLTIELRVNYSADFPSSSAWRQVISGFFFDVCNYVTQLL